MEARVDSENLTILLVDDEDMILNVVSEFLKVLGYEVLIAKGGHEAVRVFEAHGNRIDVVILDFLMPEMEGSQVLDLLRKSDPKVKVLICSGLTLESLQDDVLDLPANGFLQKPFAIGTLKQKIEGLLKSVQGETKGGPRRTPS